MRGAASRERHESARRLDVARGVARAYAANPRVVALLVAGSVGRAEADAHSDVDVDVYWSAPPSDGERRQAISAAGGALVGEIAPVEEEEWAETFALSGLRLTTSMFLTDTMERYLSEVIDGASIAELPQIRIAALQLGTPLLGEAVIDRWRTRASAYPDRLRRAMVRHHLRHHSTWHAAAVLAERDDAVLLYDTLVRAVRAILGALHGLNRLYLSHPGYKWARRLAGEMPLAPVDLADRLSSVFRLPPRQAVSALQALLDETLDLAEANFPDEDFSAARKWINAGRVGY